MPGYWKGYWLGIEFWRVPVYGYCDEIVAENWVSTLSNHLFQDI